MSFIDAKSFPEIFQYVEQEKITDFCNDIEKGVLSFYDDCNCYTETDLWAQNFSNIASLVKPKYIDEHSYVYAARYMKDLVVYIYRHIRYHREYEAYKNRVSEDIIQLFGSSKVSEAEKINHFEIMRLKETLTQNVCTRNY